MREQTTLEIFYDYNNLPVDIGEFKWVSASNHNAEIERLRSIADNLAEALEKCKDIIQTPETDVERSIFIKVVGTLAEYRGEK